MEARGKWLAENRKGNMGYCTVADVRELIKEDMFNSILGDRYIDENDAGAVAKKEEDITLLIENAIADADAEIDGYLLKRYSPPFAETPAVLRKFSKDIAAYNLMSRKGIEEDNPEKTYLTRYNSAIKFLTMVAEGKIDIGTTTEAAGQSPAAEGFRFRSSRRLFSRESMRGW